MHALDILAYQSQFKPVVVAPEPKDRQRAIEARRTAKENGDLTYYSGEPCKRGHYSERYTRNSDCIECCQLKQKKGNHG